MASSPTNTRAQATQIREAWSNLGPTQTYGGLTHAEFVAAITELDAAETALREAEDRVTAARNARVAKRFALWQLVKRARDGAKAQHGDDSDQYERFGGTRMSERKR